MGTIYDVVVVGLGVMGEATLWRLAEKNLRVLGIDARVQGHCEGSSHGASRIFRRAYWEGEKYTSMLNHADQRWRSLQALSATPLIYETGGIFIGPKGSGMVAGSIDTARRASVEHTEWSARQVKSSFPVFSVDSSCHAVYEPGAYAIAAQCARSKMILAATRQGAELLYGDAVVCVRRHRKGFRLYTRRGLCVTTNSVVLTTGPWLPNWVPELKAHLLPRRVPVYWFEPRKEMASKFENINFPVFLYELASGGLLYGLPSISQNEPGVKIGFHNRQQASCRLGAKSEEVSPLLVKEISESVGAILPDLEMMPAKAKVCIYTMSQDESFYIGRVQGYENMFAASACSGHGFKFAPAIGDVIASLVAGETTPVAIDAFSIDRICSN
ncbi:N-methyl-L-tryptophan oxidase [Pseudomonas rubra]|uniref:N-methyl-L-tryptophan oxidase n=1 Tax=Pseudomonas rubra TaxID=2942627 RepID=A0ABT5P930_9PSED|nr:N-methyl-L-tryptophan oxidase [Pseudomonas rubra]MDD1014799.1 N-methyl-L-tryptophan oxidase [Pseudomonas rubra]MDD1036501.1 N-methyl-L-tryptophan oxidase [Pseudomonas rubra]MDD1158026.1 N-methyl-L-tryptophan oxidase [Pseudomonas rubra]